MPLVTVSVVSHGQWAMTRALLLDLQHWCRDSVAQVVVTLNIPEYVDLQGVHLPVQLRTNLQPKGFGANHNAAFALCNTAWFLIINPDIRLGDDALGRLLQAAIPGAALLAPRVREPEKLLPEPFRALLTPAELVRRRLPAFQPPTHPAWLAGMFMLVRREAFEQLRGFDERFFMYCEDFDFCARLRLAGWRFEVVPDAIVAHAAQRASNTSLRPLLWHLASLWKLWTSRAFWRYRRLLKS